MGHHQRTHRDACERTEGVLWSLVCTGKFFPTTCSHRATIALLTIGAAGLFLFHEKRVGLSHSRAVTVKELQRLTALIDDLGGAYGVCTRAMAKEMFVFTAQLNKSCLDPIQVQLNAFDKQLQTSMPLLDAVAIEEISQFREIMTEDFRQAAIATQMTEFFEKEVITSLRYMCSGNKLTPPTQSEKDNLRKSQHDAANAQLAFYFLARDFVLPGLTSMESRLAVVSRRHVGESIPASLAQKANVLPDLLLERRNYRFKTQQQPLSLSVVKTHSSRSIKTDSGGALDFVEQARQAEVFQRAMTESLKGKPKDIEALIACGVLKPAARTLGTEQGPE